MLAFYAFILYMLICNLRESVQVEQLLRFVVEESPEDADSKRAFKFPFISSEVLTCEIDVILKTLVEEEEVFFFFFFLNCDGSKNMSFVMNHEVDGP